jgi:hypothetical protein
MKFDHKEILTFKLQKAKWNSKKKLLVNGSGSVERVSERQMTLHQKYNLITSSKILE